MNRAILISHLLHGLNAVNTSIRMINHYKEAWPESHFNERELTFTFSICYRPSLCLSVCLSSVTFVHPTQSVEIFGNFSSPFGTLAIHCHSLKIVRRSSQGNPSDRLTGGLNARGVAKYSDFLAFGGHGHISETVKDKRLVSINH